MKSIFIIMILWVIWLKVFVHPGYNYWDVSQNWPQNPNQFYHRKSLWWAKWSHRVEKKNAKICKISGEKWVFAPQISYIILRWNAVNAVKLSKFTARLSGDRTKVHHNSPLKYVISPPLQGFEPLTSCMSSTSSSTAPYLTKF